MPTPNGLVNGMDPVKVRYHVEGLGVSPVCATCRHYWKARDKGVPGTACIGPERCGSPMAGDIFYGYDGPFSREHLAAHCFVCNHPADHGLAVEGKKGVIGVCGKHMQLVIMREALGPLKEVAELPDKVWVVSSDGLTSLRDLRNAPRKPNLVETIRKNERERLESLLSRG